MKRGIVTAPGILNQINNGFKMERGLSLNELKYYTLYFDELVIPDNNMISIGVTNQEELIKLGVLKRPRYKTASLHSNDYIKFQSIIVMDELEKLQSNDTSTIWTYHQMEGASLIIPDEFKEKKKTLQIELINQLPVPNENVSFEELLKFKEKRNDEFKKLHNTIDSMYLEILKSPDYEITKKKIFYELNQDIINIKKVSKEKWHTTFDFSMNYEFSLKDLVLNSGKGILFDKMMGTFPLGTVTGALASAIDIKAISSMTVKNQNQNNQLSYLTHAYKNKSIMIDKS